MFQRELAAMGNSNPVRGMGGLFYSNAAPTTRNTPPSGPNSMETGVNRIRNSFRGNPSTSPSNESGANNDKGILFLVIFKHLSIRHSK